MNFFELQDKARSQTRYLAGLFLLAVFLIIIAINFILLLVVNLQTTEPYSLREWLAQPYWIYLSASISALIFITSLVRSWQLRTTPDAIARMVKATPVSLNSTDLQERRLINVVEEMSIASGVPIPHLYVMKAEGRINAFVAGLDPENIVLVVTQGLLDSLNRHELQGVIAHEYSHIFHGDMRINVKLIGILAGILVIGQLGMILLRSSSHRSYSSRSSGGNALPVLAIGAGLFVIGYIGLFFGRLIKAAISRQREFLADASAIQYTRDNQGICSALYKISRHQKQAYLDSDKAEEMSHLCFGQSVKLSFSRWLATHPPIDARIAALNPDFQFDANQSSHSSEESVVNVAEKQSLSQTPFESINAAQAFAQVGEISPQHIATAHHTIEAIPAALLAVARAESDSASEKDCLIALLRANQSATAKNSGEKYFNQLASHSQIDALTQQIKLLDFKKQHILLELALARLNERSEAEKREFVALMSRLVKSGQFLTLSEFMIYASCAKRVLRQQTTTKEFTRFKPLEKEITALFNLLYQQSAEEQNFKQAQFNKRLKLLGLPHQPLNQSPFSTNDLATALNQLSKLHPLLKKDLLSLCVEIVESDGLIMQKEYEILRLLGEYLGCPFPIALE